MENKDNQKWYFKNWSLIISFLCVGPFMLPLIWANPRFSKKIKIITSVVIIVITYLLSVFFLRSLKSIGNYYQILSLQD